MDAKQVRNKYPAAVYMIEKKLGYRIDCSILYAAVMLVDRNRNWLNHISPSIEEGEITGTPELSSAIELLFRAEMGQSQQEARQAALVLTGQFSIAEHFPEAYAAVMEASGGLHDANEHWYTIVVVHRNPELVKQICVIDGIVRLGAELTIAIAEFVMAEDLGDAAACRAIIQQVKAYQASR